MGSQYDAVVVGSGPNGLSAAITLKSYGLSVLLLEGRDTIGGGMRSYELISQGYVHDMCSTVHPMAVISPFFQQLPLEKFGLEWIYPSICAAHLMDNGEAVFLYHDVYKTANQFKKEDETLYLKLFEPNLQHFQKVLPNILSPLRFPEHPMTFINFAIKAIQPASWIAKKFNSPQAKALWAGMAAHAMQPLDSWATSGVAMVLMLAAHYKGWPLIKGGTQKLANALANYFSHLGGIIQTNCWIKKISDLPSAKVYLFDTSPKCLVSILGNQLSKFYKIQLSRFQYGMGVYKMDWIIEGEIPFTNEECKNAGTIHLGGFYEEIAKYERSVSTNIYHADPFVLLVQPTKFDRIRSVNQNHIVWAYCHVPLYSTVDMSEIIENKIERFAPGFKKRIISKKTFHSKEMEQYNPNYVGGDIGGGALTITQLYTRPVVKLIPYRTSKKNIYICSASTPPGGGVHGMCGYHAAITALRDHF
jgi:phytoene dehydrogenase-like protein